MDGINKVRNFIERTQDDSWKRALVCGIFFLSDSLALNIRQLRLLIGKCKSSINGSLYRLGYAAQSSSRDGEQEFLSRLPVTLRDSLDLKTWTIRRTTEARPRRVPSPPPPEPNVSVETEAVHVRVLKTFPCPVKCRYKYMDIIHRSVSIQTGWESG
jgi:hypothetical protein